MDAANNNNNNNNNNDNNNEEACAVCRHLDKQCNETCIFAPYFPVERTEEFNHVHRIFGIHNVTQIVSCVEENERATTIETLVLEANMRVHDMVHGSYGVEKSLREQYENALKELDLVNQQLRYLRGSGEASQPANEDPPSDQAGPSDRSNQSDLKGKKKM